MISRLLSPSGAKRFGDEVQIVLQRFLAVDHAQPAAQAGDNIVPQILFVGDGQDAVFIRYKKYTNDPVFIDYKISGQNGLLPSLGLFRLYALVPFPTGIGQPFAVQRVTAKHTAHSIGKKALDVPLQVGLADSYILVLHLRGQLVL